MNRPTITRHLVTALVMVIALLWLWPTAAHAQSSTTTIRGTGLQPLVEESGSSQTLNIYGPGGVIIAQVATESATGGTPTTETRYLLHDHLGSTRVVLDSNNQVLGSFDYSPFGETTPTGNVANVAYRYTGQEVNGALGTYNYHARQYDAGVGRFLRVDPARQFASPYVYVGNNPINGVDPTGGIDIPVDAETFNQLGRASRAIEWARKRLPYASNNRSDIAATHAESSARNAILRRIERRYPPKPTRNDELLAYAGMATATCAGNCDELNGLTYAYLTFVEPDPTYPILSVGNAHHTFTLIGDPRELSQGQVIVADAWPTHPQAARLADTRWHIDTVDVIVSPTAELTERHQRLFSSFQHKFGKDWRSITGTAPEAGYNLADPEDSRNSIGRRTLGITDFATYTRDVLNRPSVYDRSYSTYRAEPYNYVLSDDLSTSSRANALGVIFDPFGIAADLQGIR